MLPLVITDPRFIPGLIRSMSPRAIDNVRALERLSLDHVEQVLPITYHLIHAGMYHRTILVPKGMTLTGALIKRATTVIMVGDASMYGGDGEEERFTGYTVRPAMPGRKQAFYAWSDTYLTMIFPTKARTIAEAEAEFTDEADRLFSRRGQNEVHITEEL